VGVGEENVRAPLGTVVEAREIGASADTMKAVGPKEPEHGSEHKGPKHHGKKHGPRHDEKHPDESRRFETLVHSSRNPLSHKPCLFIGELLKSEYEGL
jgi:hypothetical protein